MSCIIFVSHQRIVVMEDFSFIIVQGFNDEIPFWNSPTPCHEFSIFSAVTRLFLQMPAAWNEPRNQLTMTTFRF